MGKTDLDELLTVQEVAQLARIHRNTFDRWCKQGKGPRPAKLPVRRYALRDVQNWLAQERQQLTG